MFRYIVTGIVLIAILLVIGMIANYRFPSFFDVQVDPTAPIGATYVDTVITISKDLNSNWMPNDIFWPSILLDNPQAFQLGSLEMVRYSIRVLRDNLSRMRTTDNINADVDKAYTSFSNDPKRWIWPSAESKWKEGIKSLTKYRSDLDSGHSKFFPRADNLIELLNQYNSLLGGVTTRLSNIPSDMNVKLTEETAGDQNFEGESIIRLDINWWDIDYEFYYAQGTAYTMRQMLLAIKRDFSEILKLKKATELLDNIIYILDHTQWEPKYTVMNCVPGSWIPCQNDPMMLGSRLQDVRQKVSSIVSMLKD